MPVHSLLCYGAASNNLAFHFFSNWEGHVIVVFSKYKVGDCDSSQIP